MVNTSDKCCALVQGCCWDMAARVCSTTGRNCVKEKPQTLCSSLGSIPCRGHALPCACVSAHSSRFPFAKSTPKPLGARLAAGRPSTALQDEQQLKALLGGREERPRSYGSTFQYEASERWMESIKHMAGLCITLKRIRYEALLELR